MEDRQSHDSSSALPLQAQQHQQLPEDEQDLHKVLQAKARNEARNEHQRPPPGDVTRLLSKSSNKGARK